MSKKIAPKKAPNKLVEKPRMVVIVRKTLPVASDLQKKREEIDSRLKAIIDRNKPGVQLSAELEASIHCHKCNHQVQVDDLFCEQCGVPLIGKCGNCGIEKARKDPCPICKNI